MEKKLVAIFILAGLFLYRILVIFSYNGALDGIDNNFVYDVVRLLGAKDIYTNPSEAPYAITLYSPLYYNICAGIGKLFHVNPDEPIQVYQLCRTVSLVCDIITFFLLYRLLRRRFHIPAEYSWLAAAAFACVICILGYTFSRSDGLLLTFYAATMFVLVNPLPRVTITRPLLLALLSAACIFSKQNGILVPVLVLTWLLLQKEKKVMLQYAILFILLLAAGLAFYRSIYPDLFSNTITALQNRIDWSWFYRDIFKRAMNSLWILPLYIAAAIAIRQWIKPASGIDRALAAIFIIQSLFSLATSLKWGSSVGYFNESYFLAFIIITRLVIKANTDFQYNILKKGTVLFLPLLVLFFIQTVGAGYLAYIQGNQKKRGWYEQQKQVRDYLASKQGVDYTLNISNPNIDFFKTLLYRNNIVPNFDMVICCTMPDNTFDYSKLRQDLETADNGYIITYKGEKPATLWGVSLDRFTEDTTINGYSIYTSSKSELINSTLAQ
jgi:hypothetical protein